MSDGKDAGPPADIMARAFADCAEWTENLRKRICPECKQPFTHESETPCSDGDGVELFAQPCGHKTCERKPEAVRRLARACGRQAR